MLGNSIQKPGAQCRGSWDSPTSSRRTSQDRRSCILWRTGRKITGGSMSGVKQWRCGRRREKPALERKDEKGRRDQGSRLLGNRERMSSMSYRILYLIVCCCRCLLLTNVKLYTYCIKNLSRSPPLCIQGPTHCLQLPWLFSYGALHRIFPKKVINNVDTSPEVSSGPLVVGLQMSDRYSIVDRLSWRQSRRIATEQSMTDVSDILLYTSLPVIMVK